MLLCLVINSISLHICPFGSLSSCLLLFLHGQAKKFCIMLVLVFAWRRTILDNLLVVGFCRYYQFRLRANWSCATFMGCIREQEEILNMRINLRKESIFTDLSPASITHCETTRLSIIDQCWQIDANWMSVRILRVGSVNAHETGANGWQVFF